MSVAPLLEGVVRRQRVRTTIRVLTAAILLGGLSYGWWRVAGPLFAAAVALLGVATGAALRWRRRDGDRPLPATLLVERRAPAFRNLFITAVEIEQGRLTVTPATREVVLREAGERAASVRPADIVPIVAAARELLLAAAATILVVLATSSTGAGPAVPASLAGASDVATAEVRVRATVTPPAYLRDGGKTRVLDDPERIDVLEGSRLRLVAEHGEIAWRSPREQGTPAAVLDVSPGEDGFIAVFRAEQAMARGISDNAMARVIPVGVTRDERPRVAIESPARDLVVSGREAIAVSAEAMDDFGLTGAEMRYTRVSGSGEQFEFKEGVLPIAIARASGRQWRLSAKLDLARFGLEPGDTLVYRFAARDGRGAAGTGLSDAFIVEVPQPGQAVTAGTEADVGDDRFALSQQMVLLKLQRLHAARRSLDAAALRERSLALAAEQRSVRALVIFMLGGEVEDEEIEAAHSYEIQEGRLEDSSRKDLALATTLMSQVERRLTDADTRAALPPAEAAVESLQRAFGRRRYFLRTAPVRMRIDRSRRLSASGEGVGGVTLRPTFERNEDRGPASLASLFDLAASVGRNGATTDVLSTAAARVLAVDPGSAALQAVAVKLQSVEPADRASVRDAVAEAIAALVARERARQPGEQQPRMGDELRGAWGAEWRGRVR